jgi:hypothetical protein
VIHHHGTDTSATGKKEIGYMNFAFRRFLCNVPAVLIGKRNGAYAVSNFFLHLLKIT